MQPLLTVFVRDLPDSAVTTATTRFDRDCCDYWKVKVKFLKYRTGRWTTQQDVGSFRISTTGRGRNSRTVRLKRRRVTAS